MWGLFILVYPDFDNKIRTIAREVNSQREQLHSCCVCKNDGRRKKKPAEKASEKEIRAPYGKN